MGEPEYVFVPGTGWVPSFKITLRVGERELLPGDKILDWMDRHGYKSNTIPGLYVISRVTSTRAYNKSSHGGWEEVFHEYGSETDPYITWFEVERSV